MKETTDISKEEYERIKAKYDFYHAERVRIFPVGKCSFTPEDQALLPESPTHDEISSMEVYEFRHAAFPSYFAYVHETKYRRTYSLTDKGTVYTIPEYVTTWTGEVLGKIIDWYAPYKSNMGDERINITAKMINGKVYHGTFYVGVEDYCRLKIAKNQ